MAYQGWLIKVGDYTIPLSIIKADSYIPFLSTIDLDSYVDENTLLHRNVIGNPTPKVEFETVPMLDNTQFAQFMSNIRAQYTNAREKKCPVTAYQPEIDDYVTQDCYIPDIKPQLYLASATEIKYDAIRIAFIGYGG